ncbi:YcxB family protein [Actinoplanes regularis]|uniref:YcxB family protein n=1 Tax=Actinoplanes regularis TaxID=52697 RepID=UPI0024A5E8EC|nr:YcxB family protein [Actinoplanes regularis]GLW28822.1 hypothetical protein Areg01_17620 [Actinoplanes regularis]
MTSDVIFAFSAQPDEEQTRAALRHLFRQNFVLIRSLGTALFLIGLISLTWDGSASLSGICLGLGVAFVFVVPPLVLRRIWRKMSSTINLPITYRVDDQGVFVANELIEQLLRWPAVTRIEELPGMTILRVGDSAFVTLRTGELSAEEAAALTEFVKARVGRAA